MANVCIKRGAIMKHVTLNVQVEGGLFGRYEWRRHLGVALIRLAAWVLDLRVELVYRKAS